MQLVHVRRVPFAPDRGQPPYENVRHYFFNMGNDSLFAFFEYPKGLKKSDRDLPGGMQHVAFHVPEKQFNDLIAHAKVGRRQGHRPVQPRPSLLVGLSVRPERHPPRIRDPARRRGQASSNSARQTEEEARAELETLLDDPAEIDRWLAEMPLKRD